MYSTDRLIETLNNNILRPDAVVMQGFFLDHFITYLGDGGSVDSYIKRVQELAELGGGNIAETKQQILRGGKGLNSSSALATLGGHVHYFGRTDEFGLHLIKFFTKGKDIDLSHVKTDGELSMTAAIELKYHNKLINAMLNYAGSEKEFGFEHLDASDLSLLETTDYLLMTEWTMNYRKGTELAEKVFDYAKDCSCIKFFDPGDPTWRKQDIPSLVERVFLQSNFNILGVNESEALWFSSYFDTKYLERGKREDKIQLGLECSQFLHDKLGVRVDLHTADFSASFDKGEAYIVPTFNIGLKRVTGAGDSWTAGNAFGELVGLDSPERLLLANASAGFYISNSKGEHATISDIISFMENQKVKPLKPSFKVN